MLGATLRGRGASVWAGRVLLVLAAGADPAQRSQAGGLPASWRRLHAEDGNLCFLLLIFYREPREATIREQPRRCCPWGCGAVDSCPPQCRRSAWPPKRMLKWSAPPATLRAPRSQGLFVTAWDSAPGPVRHPGPQTRLWPRKDCMGLGLSFPWAATGPPMTSIDFIAASGGAGADARYGGAASRHAST